MSRILSIDGGGIRGIYSAHILSRLGKELEVSWAEDFDLIAGTSTGSILAAALAFGVDIEIAKSLYRKHGPKIFRSRWRSFAGMAGARYDTTPLRTALEEIFGEATLADAETRLIIPATDIANGQVHIFKSTYDEGFVRDRDVRVVDAVAASCSAPTYFSPSRVNEYLLCDGGLWANNPSMIASVEALTRLGKDRKEVFLLSIGNGEGKDYYPIKTGKSSWGFLTGWKRGLFISMILDLQSKSSANMVRLLLPPENIIRMNYDSNQPLVLDDVAAIDNLVSKADTLFTHEFDNLKSWWKASA